MSTVTAGQSVQLQIGAFEGLWVNCSGVGFIDFECKSRGTIQLTSQYQRIGYYGESVCVELRCVTGVIDYSTTPVAFESLTAKQAGDASDSSPLDLKLNVNGLQDGSVGFDAITLKGLPNTPGAPAGYGDLAAALVPDEVMAFDPLQWGGWVAQTVVGSNIYGCNSSDVLSVYRSGLDLQAAAIGNPINGGAIVSPDIKYVIALDDQNILAMVEDADLRFHMFKTSDGCNTWSLVWTPDRTHVKTLTDRSICKAVVNGETVLYFGEYNFNPAATGFNAESKLILWKSTDLGSTWTAAVTWNTAGVNNTRHMHCVKQFEPNGPIYVCFGDTDAQSAIVKWDGVTAWPSNTSWPDIVQSEGLKLYYGRQSARAVDLVESGGRIYYLNDTYSSFRGDATEQAVWSFGESFDDFTNESQPMSVAAEHAGWLACKDEDERIFFISAPDATVIAGSKFVGVIGSNKEKTSFKMAGAYRVLDNATASVPYGFFFAGGNIYLTATKGSGKGADNSVSFKVSDRVFRGDYETKYIPDTIHPVYWCDYLSGNSSNSGVNPSVAVADIRNLLLGDKVPYGARIQLMREFNNFDGAAVSWKTNAVSASFQGDPTEPVAIYGYGATKTKLSYPASGSVTGTLFSITGANATNARLADLTVETLKPSQRLFDVSQNSGQNNNLSFVRCIVGNPTILSSAIVRAANGLVKCYGTIIGIGKDSHTFASTLSVNDPLKVTLDNCLMLSASTHFNLTNEITTNEIKLYNTKHFGYSTAAINMTGAASVQLAGWNVVMSTTYNLNNGAVIGGGTVTGKLQNSTVRGIVNNTTAFADNCKLGLYPMYDFNYSDYID